MNLKRISLIVLLLGLVLLLGCSKKEKAAEPRHIDWDSNKEHLNVLLKNGARLYAYEEDRTEKNVILSYFANDDSVKPDELKWIYTLGEKDAFNIFYVADWETNRYMTHDSCVIPITFHGKKDYLIFVSHNYLLNEESCTGNYDGAIPIDTLGTKPYGIHDELYHSGFPMWIFDIAEADLTDDYELHFEDYVLTAADLRSKSWRNGDAPILK